MVVYVFAFFRVYLNDRFFVTPEDLFDFAHFFPRQRSARQRHAYMLPAHAIARYHRIIFSTNPDRDIKHSVVSKTFIACQSSTSDSALIWYIHGFSSAQDIPSSLSRSFYVV